MSLDQGVGAVCLVCLDPSEDWGLDDPHGQPIEKAKEIRDEIEPRVEALLVEMQNQ